MDGLARMSRKSWVFFGVGFCKLLACEGLKIFEKIGFCCLMAALLIENHEFSLIGTNFFCRDRQELIYRKRPTPTSFLETHSRRTYCWIIVDELGALGL